MTPDGPLDPLQRLEKDGAGAAEVDADETRGLVAEDLAVAEIDAGLFQEEIVEPAGLDPEPAAVEKREIGPLGPDEPDAGNALLEESLEEIDVGLEVDEERVEPFVAVAVGGLEADDAEDLAEVEARSLGLVLESS